MQRRLVERANFILINQYWEPLGLENGPTTYGPRSVTESAANSAATIRVDGVKVPAVEVDTDPFVHALGLTLNSTSSSRRSSHASTLTTSGSRSRFESPLNRRRLRDSSCSGAVLRTALPRFRLDNRH